MNEAMDVSEAAGAPMALSCPGGIDDALVADQEGVVSRFASLMGTDSSASSESNAMSMLACLSSTVGDGDVICTLPSLDLKVSEDGDNPLPAVGQHMPGKPRDASSHMQPIMEASILGTGAALARDDEDQFKEAPKAAGKLCATTSWTKSSIVYAPDALMKNVAKSFSGLIDSRVRSWTLLMFKQSLTSGGNSSRANILQMLAASIKVNPVRSTLKTLPLPESAKSQVKEADVILPLLFEVILEVGVQDRSEMVTLRAPGTVSGRIVRLHGEY